MDKIEVKILNPDEVKNAEKMMVCAARLTQQGHKIQSMYDFEQLYNKSYSATTITNMASLPHPTIQKFGVINVVVTGASRRFLAQITRHQNEVKFMSASLQYSDYSDTANNFVVPYDILNTNMEKPYLESCTKAMDTYREIVADGKSNDSAGYAAPQALRNILIISATPYQWKHMISQRVCNRNTVETQYVMLLIWAKLFELSPEIFSVNLTGPFCAQDYCKEGSMSCNNCFKISTPQEKLEKDFSKCFKKD